MADNEKTDNSQGVLPLREEAEKDKLQAHDPFADKRETFNPFAAERGADTGTNNNVTPVAEVESPADRRASTAEWDAAKTPPSRFQQRKGSVYATPNSRDGHVEKNSTRDAKFHALVDKMTGGKRKSSSAKGSEKE